MSTRLSRENQETLQLLTVKLNHECALLELILKFLHYFLTITSLRQMTNGLQDQPYGTFKIFFVGIHRFQRPLFCPRHLN